MVVANGNGNVRIMWRQMQWISSMCCVQATWVALVASQWLFVHLFSHCVIQSHNSGEEHSAMDRFNCDFHLKISSWAHAHDKSRTTRVTFIIVIWILAIFHRTELAHEKRINMEMAWNVDKILTQFTTGGNNDADIATPIKGPDAPSSSANATPEPDVSAHATPIHSERALPL